ncbi:MAG: aspartate kinase [Candidatus Nanopelagicales bacterium]|nr:aspartate kinase [Candidatus Nanopelagicales bacterium]MDZ4250193.1 aspartate kinase [Candidatus Nanopelagicales bacterium]
MALVVQKFGGSSVGDAEAIRRVARRIVDTCDAGNQVIVVVSAMGDSTDDLTDLAMRVSPNPPGRELDMLLTAGERISMALLAMAIHDNGREARSYTGSQAGLLTTSTHGRARIIDVTPGRIQSALDDGAIPIVAGFQGVSQDTKDVTTLGRGGSDTTAVALAAALSADVCEIYTDVDGVFTADPRLVPKARMVRRIAYEDMLELAAVGTKVLHVRCVEYARRVGIPIHVRSSFSNTSGTWVVPDPTEGGKVEQPTISGVASDLNEAKITVLGVVDEPGKAAGIFQSVAGAHVNIDMIVQNVSAATTGRTDVTFTCAKEDIARAVDSLEDSKHLIGFDSLVSDKDIAKISLVGAGMRSHPGVSATFFSALADQGINIEMISTSEIRISVVIRAQDASRALRAVHTAFGLDAEGEAVVYAGTGR